MDDNCLGWDCSVTGKPGYLGKGGGFSDGSAGLQTFFGILAGRVPVVVATNSPLWPLWADLSTVVQTAPLAATSAR
jgi:hypothetical protein